MLSNASEGGGIGGARASSLPVGSGACPRRSRRIATRSTTRSPAKPERADDAQLLATLAARRCVLRALGLHVGKRLDAVLLDGKHEL